MSRPGSTWRIFFVLILISVVLSPSCEGTGPDGNELYPLRVRVKSHDYVAVRIKGE